MQSDSVASSKTESHGGSSSSRHRQSSKKKRNVRSNATYMPRTVDDFQLLKELLEFAPDDRDVSCCYCSWSPFYVTELRLNADYLLFSLPFCFDSHLSVTHACSVDSIVCFVDGEYYSALLIGRMSFNVDVNGNGCLFEVCLSWSDFFLFPFQNSCILC